MNADNGFPRSVPLPVLRVVAKAIRYAWASICSDPAKHLLKPGPKAPEEDVYTDSLCRLLNQMLAIDPSPIAGFNGAIIDSIERAASVVNYNGEEINKNPDLVIRLANEPLVATRHWVGIFVEAKVVSTSHHMDGYGSDGVGRFVRGEYAWAMRDSLMLAYQKPKHRPMTSLADRLASDTALRAQAQDGILLVAQDAFVPICGRSIHGRDWAYLGGGTPGTIQVWHLWDLATPVPATLPTAAGARRATPKRPKA